MEKCRWDSLQYLYERLGSVSLVNHENAKFYFDESNNIRTLYITDKVETNISTYDINKNFILGGLMTNDKNTAEDISLLRNKLHLQKSILEIKFNHICAGKSKTFKDCLSSKELKKILEWIFNSNYYIHFINIDLLYWSIVDIVDELININEKDTFIAINHREIKNVLFLIVKRNLKVFINLIYKFKYPNVESESIEGFLNELVGFIKKNSETSKYDKYRDLILRLTDYLEMAKKSSELVFLQNNVTKEKKSKIKENHKCICSSILIENFAHFYIDFIYKYNKAELIFDREDSLVELIDQGNYRSNTDINKHYRFEDSKSNLYLQFSDVMMGLLARLFEFLTITSINQLEDFYESLNKVQMTNLSLLFGLIKKTDNFCPILTNLVLPDDTVKKYLYLGSLTNG
ncbi:hypothetical protein [Ignatzschineria cameli]|uniref:hypothetical protein n=1 Tax=Ignatzschineria cameli TaxID=2182793 RepID=UPI000D62167E|nr:hypothetical protein [Ignatzschineria cameli]PWD85356.1 hypothetical protein DC080_06780 [Ignatzschineria cameli]